ncbi:MAG: tungstate transporter permease [Planctomycetaceae bacterium]|nr:tungstate transporter permease [Planctomycetaceae bacterium]
MQLLWDGLIGALQLLVDRDPLVLGAAWRSLWISGLAVGLAGGLGIPLGLLLAQSRFVGRSLCVLLFRAGMSIPTVLIGLVCYALFSRRGPLGGLDLLYTPWGILAGECALALPIIVTWTHRALCGLDRRAAETAWTLGASRMRRGWLLLSEARVGIALALLTAFARCLTELGIAMMIGGNVKYRTRTLTTATALETARGEFDRGVAMSTILLLVAVVVTVLHAGLDRGEKEA